MDFKDIGKLLIFFGLIIIISGFLLYGLGNITNWKKLPGDIFYKSDRVTIFFPIVTMVIISIILTIVLNVIFFIMRR